MDTYTSPLSSRYASAAMQKLFSPDTRYGAWRKLWTSLARAEHALGLPVTEAQVTELAAHVTDIDYDVVAARERECRHDVMAHIYAYGLVCPTAAPVIHLGATSCYVTDNADIILLRDALSLIRDGVYAVLHNLAAFAERYKAVPALGYTHFQPAQPVTMGKRACLWMQDLLLDIEELTDALGAIRFLGCRGATGTEASFLELFNGDAEKIDRLNEMIAADFGFARCYDVCGQTYPRKLDSRVLNALSSVAQSVYKFADDVRLLQHDGQLYEPFGSGQVGSSAMAYKRNPMRSERICSLARFVMVTAQNAPLTASAQWLERTLDDSANRRIALPEAFLATDAVLRVMADVTKGMTVNERVTARLLDAELPFIATENLLMEAVRAGGDRQRCHEIIRARSMECRARMQAGEEGDLIGALADDDGFPLSREQMRGTLAASAYVGRSVEQTERFLASHPIPDCAEPEPLAL